MLPRLCYVPLGFIYTALCPTLCSVLIPASCLWSLCSPVEAEQNSSPSRTGLGSDQEDSRTTTMGEKRRTNTRTQTYTHTCLYKGTHTHRDTHPHTRAHTHAHTHTRTRTRTHKHSFVLRTPSSPASCYSKNTHSSVLTMRHLYPIIYQMMLSIVRLRTIKACDQSCSSGFKNKDYYAAQPGLN